VKSRPQRLQAERALVWAAVLLAIPAIVKIALLLRRHDYRAATLATALSAALVLGLFGMVRWRDRRDAAGASEGTYRGSSQLFLAEAAKTLDFPVRSLAKGIAELLSEGRVSGKLVVNLDGMHWQPGAAWRSLGVPAVSVPSSQFDSWSVRPISSPIGIGLLELTLDSGQRLRLTVANRVLLERVLDAAWPSAR
jgi:hypothetical protein